MSPFVAWWIDKFVRKLGEEVPPVECRIPVRESETCFGVVASSEVDCHCATVWIWRGMRGLQKMFVIRYASVYEWGCIHSRRDGRCRKFRPQGYESLRSNEPTIIYSTSARERKEGGKANHKSNVCAYPSFPLKLGLTSTHLFGLSFNVFTHFSIIIFPSVISPLIPSLITSVSIISVSSGGQNLSNISSEMERGVGSFASQEPPAMGPDMRAERGVCGQGQFLMRQG